MRPSAPPSGADAASEACLHASAVAGPAGGLLILGPSGSGKSSLALALLARGAALVSDDIVVARRAPGAGTDGAARLTIGPPEGAAPRIEARGLGILDAPAAGRVTALAAVRMDIEEGERLPPRRSYDLLGVRLRMFHNTGRATFADALALYLRVSESLT